MKILMTTPGFHPIKGGTESVVRNLSVELNRIGVHTDVMTFNMDRKYKAKWRGKTEKLDGVTVFKVPALDWFPIEHTPRITMNINLIPGKITNLLKKYDIIHFHELDFSFPLFSYFVRKPKIFHLHGIDFDFLKRYHLSRAILKHVTDYYITITTPMGRELTELGIDRNRIIYLPNAIDINQFYPQGEKEDNLLLYLGRIVPVKGLHVLLESLRYVEKPVSLVIAGPIGDPDYYKEAEKRIERENQKGKHRITYLGKIPDEEVLKIYQKASVFLLPSFFEAFPVAILEALSCETPVITTPVGGNPEVIRNFENGILVPVNKPLRLAEAINFMIDNKDKRIKMGRKARETVTKNFSVEVIAKRLHEIYQTIITR